MWHMSKIPGSWQITSWTDSDQHRAPLSVLHHQYFLLNLLYKIHITQISGICGNTCFVTYFVVCLFLCVCQSALLKLSKCNLDIQCELLGSIYVDPLLDE